jgi:hypothetical protein
MTRRSLSIPLALWLVTAALTAAPVSVNPALPFIEDDYGRALSLAREKKIPIFVEAWAPW